MSYLLHSFNKERLSQIKEEGRVNLDVAEHKIMNGTVSECVEAYLTLMTPEDYAQNPSHYNYLKALKHQYETVQDRISTMKGAGHSLFSEAVKPLKVEREMLAIKIKQHIPGLQSVMQNAPPPKSLPHSSP